MAPTGLWRRGSRHDPSVDQEHVADDLEAHDLRPLGGRAKRREVEARLLRARLGIEQHRGAAVDPDERLAAAR